MLTDIELDDMCKEHKVPLVFIGCKDQLGKHRKRNGGYIVNLQDSVDEEGNPNSGTHWVACFVNGKHQYYFDSFGFPPPKAVVHFLSHRFQWNRMDIQNINSGVCGYYCFFFLWAMTNFKGPPDERWKRFLGMWSKDVTKNRTRLMRFIAPI